MELLFASLMHRKHLVERKLDNMFSLAEMENMFEIGSIIEAQIRDGFIDSSICRETLCAIALDMAQRFEMEYPDTDDYYGDIDAFFNERFPEKFRKSAPMRDEKDLWVIDKFALHDDRIYWVYYNPDGNDGNGQIVETVIYPEDVLVNSTDEDEFWGHLSSVCKTYLYDRGEKDFDVYVSCLLKEEKNTDVLRNNVTPDTIEWLIDWTKKYI